MRRLDTITAAILSVALLTACGGETEPEKTPATRDGNHVWKSQTDQLQQARDMADDVNRRLQDTQKQIEQRQ